MVDLHEVAIAAAVFTDVGATVGLAGKSAGFIIDKYFIYGFIRDQSKAAVVAPVARPQSQEREQLMGKKTI